MPSLPVPVLTVVLLIGSNLFMTVAWYGHLRFKEAPIWTVILISWAIALFEYMLQVPANRYGYGTFTAPQLKTIQEVITLLTFAVFSTLYLKEPLGWNHAVGFAFIFLGAWFIFHKWT
ncbi:MAG: DMT family protein [bacterium]